MISVKSKLSILTFGLGLWMATSQSHANNTESGSNVENLSYSGHSTVSGVCQSYVAKVSKQLDACKKHTACLEQPFKHAMNVKNYSTRYMGCKHIFDAAITARLNAPEHPNHEQIEELQAELAKAKASLAVVQEKLKNQIDKLEKSVAADCSKAFYFLTYATKSCATGSCVDQQFRNTLNVPAFRHCAAPLAGLRDARKTSLPNSNYSYSYSSPGMASGQTKPSH